MKVYHGSRPTRCMASQCIYIICKDLYNFNIASSLIFMHVGCLKKIRNFKKKMTVTGMNLRDLNVLLLHYPLILCLIPGIV